MTFHSVSVVWVKGYPINRCGNRHGKKGYYFVENSLIRGSSLIRHA